ncbi:MAG: tripartite tricarboxylate transporter substrate binding protein [Variibacter sp.]|nr:tripartite tricarboxylate transporter substrate binding protein [Variibacter sp.]
MPRRALLALAALLLVGSSAAAQETYPSRPVRILVPYVPGGATDIAARVVAERLKHILGQSFVVENRPGAFGIIAVEEMVRAKPDGYTLMVGNPSTNAITPIVHAKRMSIDYEKSVVALARLVDLPSFLLVTTKDFPPKSVAELVAYAKANPGKIRYGSAGVGSFPHYGMEVFAKQAGIEMVHVPNKGGGAAYLKDMMTGDVQVGTMNVATAAPILKNGTVRPIAVTEETRLAEFPDIPSLAELGYSRPGTGFWHSLFAHAATPRPILEKLHAAILEAMKSPDVVAAFAKNHMRRIPHPTLDEEQAWLVREIAAWRQITSQVPIEMAE